MRIEILGPGCPRCRKTGEIVAEAVKELGVEAEIVYIHDLGEIIERGVMMTPAVIIDGVKKVEGRIPTRAQVLEWLK